MQFISQIISQTLVLLYISTTTNLVFLSWRLNLSNSSFGPSLMHSCTTQPKLSLEMPVTTIILQVLHILVASQCCGEHSLPSLMVCKDLLGLTSLCSYQTEFSWLAFSEFIQFSIHNPITFCWNTFPNSPDDFLFILHTITSSERPLQTSPVSSNPPNVYSFSSMSLFW